MEIWLASKHTCKIRFGPVRQTGSIGTQWPNQVGFTIGLITQLTPDDSVKLIRLGYRILVGPDRPGQFYKKIIIINHLYDVVFDVSLLLIVILNFRI